MANPEQTGSNPEYGREYLPPELYRAFILLNETANSLQGKVDKAELDRMGEIVNFVDYLDIMNEKYSPTILNTEYIGSPDAVRNNFGIVGLQNQFTMNETVLFDSDDNPIFAIGDKARELILPPVDFSSHQNLLYSGVVRPRLASDSLANVAEYLKSIKDDSKFLFGLTHPRLGEIVRSRWGFDLSERPFSAFGQQFFEHAMDLPSATHEEVDAVRKLSQQVLVYQPMEEFLKRGNT